MTSLDLKTVLFAEALGSLVSLTVIILIWHQNRTKFQGLNLWVAGYLVQVAGIPLIILRGTVPDFFSFTISNTLIVSGPLLIYMGLLRFLGIKQRQWPNYLLLIAFAVFETYFSLAKPDLAVRDFLTSSVILIFSIQAAWLTLVKVPGPTRPLTRWTGITLALISLVSIGRLFGLVVSPTASDNFFNASQFDVIMLVFYVVLVVLLTFNLLLMINGRLLDEAQKYNEDLKLNSTLLDEANDAIFLRDSTGRFRYLNKKACQLLGYSRDELSQKTIQEVIVPEYMPEIATRVREMEKNGGAFFESSMYRKDRTILPLEVHARLLIHKGEQLFLSVGRDLTNRKKAEQALKESEAKYRSFFETSLEGVGISQGTQIINANPALLEIFGYSELEDFRTKSLMELMAPESRTVVEEQFKKTANGEQLENRFQYWILRKSGEKRLVEISTAHGKSGEDLLTYATFRDITERQQYEERIKDLYEKEKIARLELEEEAKARGLFIDVLAHELRTPLTPILSSTETLRDFLQSDPRGVTTRLINNIYTSTQTMAQRLEELLDVARYSRGVFEVHKQPVQLGDFLQQVIERFKPSLDRSQQQLHTQLPYNPPVVELDPSRIEQVLINLLSNASKYSPPGSGIHLGVTVQNSRLRVDIKDEGKGIPQDELANLFKPYHRVQQDRKIPGLGLGLAVSKQIVDAHGGRIWVESVMGQGSTFSFEIPIIAPKTKSS